MINEIIVSVVIGIGAGALYSLKNYFTKTPVPEFEKVKFVRTVIIGGIAGGAAAYDPLVTEDVVVTFLVNMGYVALIDKTVVIVYQKLKNFFSRYLA